MNSARLLRAVRRARQLSQRELAARAGVPRSTVGRIESGEVEPRLTTVATILSALGYRLLVADESGNPLEVDDEHDRLRDAAWRRLPAHLPVAPVTGEGDGWWGWRRIAWLPDDKRVPEATYVLRRRLPSGAYDGQWDDAT